MTRAARTVAISVATLMSAVCVFAQQTDELHPTEQQAMSDTVQYALENNKSNQSSDWVNPDTGNSGGVAPVQTFANAQGQPCREFVSTIVIGGQEQQGYGTACRQADGTWRIVPETTSSTPPAPPTTTYIVTPPPAYYFYPPDFYYPYNIYLSFGYVYRGGYVFRGSYFLDGLAFQLRYPIHVRERVFIAPHDHQRYGRLRRWWKYREPERRQIHGPYEGGRHEEWRDRDRGNERWHGR